MDPSLNQAYAAQLANSCPESSNSNNAVFLDPVTPGVFDNQYYKNLQNGAGLFFSDQILYSDTRSQPLVNQWADSTTAFEQALVSAITNLARVGVKTGSAGNIRKDCLALN